MTYRTFYYYSSSCLYKVAEYLKNVEIEIPFDLKNTIGLCNFQSTPLSRKTQHFKRPQEMLKPQHWYKVKVPPRPSDFCARLKSAVFVVWLWRSVNGGSGYIRSKVNVNAFRSGRSCYLGLCNALKSLGNLLRSWKNWV